MSFPVDMWSSVRRHWLAPYEAGVGKEFSLSLLELAETRPLSKAASVLSARFRVISLISSLSFTLSTLQSMCWRVYEREIEFC